MDRTEFLEILSRYTSTSADEAEAIASLKVQYPYSQLLHTLSARTSRDHGLKDHHHDLQMAAVYSADRVLLKEIITGNPGKPTRGAVSKPVETTKPVEAGRQIAVTPEGADVADAVMDDLDRLSKLKDTFENMFMEDATLAEKGDSVQPVEVTEQPDQQPRDTRQETPVDITPEADTKLSPVKARKQRIIEAAKALSGDPGTPSKKKHQDDQGNPVDELIAEIQSSKEEITPENERQKQQIEIINQFIRIQPSISNPRDRVPSATGDLNTIQSGEFSDNIVSETLVEILLKQGKKERAIEVLKKLIWKYPQKKAYFASQIEDLKK